MNDLEIKLASNIIIPGTDIFVIAANDNGERHRPLPWNIVMELRQRLAQISERQTVILDQAFWSRHPWSYSVIFKDD